VPTCAGGIVDLEVQNPFAMLYHIANVSPYVAKVISDSAEPSTAAAPWKLVLYGDEITPGNQLSYKGDRKFWGFYWTVTQFGSAALSDEVHRWSGCCQTPLNQRSMLKHQSMLKHCAQLAGAAATLP
jgi:hypothetical protein